MSMGLVWRETLKELLSDSLELLAGPGTHRWVTEKSFQLSNQIFAMARFDPTRTPHRPSGWLLLFTIHKMCWYASAVLHSTNA